MTGRPNAADDGDRTRARMLEIAREEITVAGWAAATSGRVAQRTGVSKALVHYHFSDKDALLRAVAVQCRDNVVARSTRVTGSTARANPVDEFLDWLESELLGQDLRIALCLKLSGRASVVRAADAVLAVVRAGIQEEAGWVFRTLGVTPGIPHEAIVDLLMAIATGEALAPTAPTSRRRMVESVWLSLLSVAE